LPNAGGIGWNNGGDLMSDQLSWAELAQLTHATQVERFNWCGCEEQLDFPYDDCPRPQA